MAKPERYGDKIGVIVWKFGRADDRAADVNVNSQVYLSDLDVDRDTEYGAVMRPFGGVKAFDGEADFVFKTYSSEDRFTVPIGVIRERGIKPGHAVQISVYELNDQQDTISAACSGEQEIEPDVDVSEELETIRSAIERIEQVNDE